MNRLMSPAHPHTMSADLISHYVRIGKRHRIRREEVYRSDATSHWPRERCMMVETDEKYANRIMDIAIRNITKRIVDCSPREDLSDIFQIG